MQRVGKAVRDAFPSWTTTLSTTCWAVGSMSRPCPDYVKHCAAVRTSQTSCHVAHTCPSRSRMSVLSQRGPPRHRMDPVRQCGCGAPPILHEHDPPRQIFSRRMLIAQAKRHTWDSTSCCCCKYSKSPASGNPTSNGLSEKSRSFGRGRHMLLVPRRRRVEAWSICIFTARTACEEHSVRCMHTSSSWSSMATGSSSCGVGMQRLVCLCLAFHNLATSRTVPRLWTYALRVCDCLPITYTCACLLCPLFTCTCIAPKISQTSASRSPTVLAILTAYATLPGCIKAASTWQTQFPVTARVHRDLWPRTSMQPKGNSAGRTSQRDSSSPMDWSPVQPHVYIYSHRLFTAKQNLSMAAGTTS